MLSNNALLFFSLTTSRKADRCLRSRWKYTGVISPLLFQVINAQSASRQPCIFNTHRFVTWSVAGFNEFIRLIKLPSCWTLIYGHLVLQVISAMKWEILKMHWLVKKTKCAVIEYSNHPGFPRCIPGLYNIDRLNDTEPVLLLSLASKDLVQLGWHQTPLFFIQEWGSDLVSADWAWNDRDLSRSKQRLSLEWSGLKRE